MILHVDLDSFFASIEQRDNPKLRGKPVAVGGPLRTRGVVATASYEARKYGIYSGMPLFRATKLCPKLILVPGNFAKYEKASRQFSKICTAFSPIIEQVSLDELYIDLFGTEKLWESAIWVGKKIQHRVEKKIGITCSVGISAQKTVAKIASGFKKPNGLTVVEPGKEKLFLAPLSIKDLPGCGRKTQEFLKKFNVVTIDDLAKMEGAHVKLLLGKTGLSLWKLANGCDFSRVTPSVDAKSISRSTTFPFDTNSKYLIEGMLFYLTERVAKDLRGVGTRGKCVSVVVRSAEFQTNSGQYTVSVSISTAHGIFKIARNLLYKLWDGNTKLRLIGVGISSFIQMKTQFQLFENCSQQKWERLEVAMDKARDKYGFLSITRASVLRMQGLR